MDETIYLDATDDLSLRDSEDSVLNSEASVSSSEASYPFGINALMDDYLYGDSYDDMTEAIDEVDDDPSLIFDGTAEESLPKSVSEQPSGTMSAEIPEETFEENNNDPNNNMDSIELQSLDTSPSPSVAVKIIRTDSSSSDEPIVDPPLELAGALSPVPGCSRDSVSHPDDPPEDERLLEKTRHILGLVARIHRDTIFSALVKDYKKPVSQLLLWDLVPESSRLEYHDDAPSTKSMKIEIRAENVGKTIVGSIGQITAKRGPAEDICTVGCKRSSSTPDISLSVPIVKSETIPRVLSSSEISKLHPIKNIPNPVFLDFPDEQLRQQSTKLPDSMNSHLPTTIAPSIVRNAFANARGAIPKIQGNAAARYGNQGRGKVLPVHQSASGPPLPKTGNYVAVKNVRFAAPLAETVFYQNIENPTTSAGNERRKTQEIAATRDDQRLQARAHAPPASRENQREQARAHAPPASRENQREQARAHAPPANRYNERQHARAHALPATQEIQRQQPLPPIQRQDRYLEEAVTDFYRIRKHGQHRENRTTGAFVLPANNPSYSQQVREGRKAHAPAHHGQQQQQNIPRAQHAIQQPRKTHGAAEQRETVAERKICMDIYYKLINIFPNVCREYLKTLCPPDWALDDRDAQLGSIVDIILADGNTVPINVADVSHELDDPHARIVNVDDTCEYLMGIFPDADPHYLRAFAEKNIDSPDAIKEFVESKLERRDYPTREQYMARLKITEQQRQYTHGFDVRQYLSIIPDPAKFFMDDARKCSHSTVAFEFLKNHFNKTRVSTISRAYTLLQCNMTMTADYLERNGADLKSKRSGMEMLTEDILLLQEIAYIKHKSEINDYIANVKKAETEEVQILKELNQLLECQCCFDAECVPSKCSNCDNGHIFCNGCIINGTSAKLSEGDTRIKCFANCGSEFDLSVLQRVLAPTTFSILLKKRQAAEVMEADLEGLVSCPFCHFASIPPEGDKIFKCLNPECTKESCRLCKELSHVPLKCDEVMKAEKARCYIEEKMTAALARKCYKCQTSFFKEEGCNKITCVCGATMCYLCDEPIKDYSHFRGQGSTDKSRCPLYSDTIRLDAVAVRQVAEQAQLEVMKINPNVRIDTTNLLPNIPLPNRGPHQDVLNADELPRRAQRAFDPQPM